MTHCELCGTVQMRNEECPSCSLYNAAVVAINAAAQHIAFAYDPRAKNAWLNDHGVFAWIGGVTQQVGSPEQAAPFAELTGAARKVRDFRRTAPEPGPANSRKDSDGSET